MGSKESLSVLIKKTKRYQGNGKKGSFFVLMNLISIVISNTLTKNYNSKFSDPNFVQGISFDMIFRFLLVKLRYLAPVIVRSKESLNVLIKKTKRYQGRGQKGLFWDFSRPWLAQASNWLAWAMK